MTGIAKGHIAACECQRQMCKLQELGSDVPIMLRLW